MNVYEARNLLLVSLGYRDYSQYLGSELWKGIRRNVLTRFPKCPCGRKATQVHHRDYARATLTGENISTLLAVCARCHKDMEITSRGKKRSSQDVHNRCEVLITNGSLNNRKANNQRPRVRPSKKRKVCEKCKTNKPVKKQRYCRPCFREMTTGRRYFDSVYLPRCKGKDCTHQAAIGKSYCRIHEADPNLSLRDYMAFRRKARKTGIGF